MSKRKNSRRKNFKKQKNSKSKNIQTVTRRSKLKQLRYVLWQLILIYTPLVYQDQISSFHKNLERYMDVFFDWITGLL